MKKLIILLSLALLPLLGFAEKGAPMEPADVDLTDQASLQRGAKLFVNYCQGCHSAKFQRYNRMAQDLGMTEDEVKQNLMFTTKKIGDTMAIAMRDEDSGNWFGNPPPDLSLITRSRGEDWVFNYLLGFYVDESRPFGFNNAVFPDVGMPHALWQLQGAQKAVVKEVDGQKVIEGFEPVEGAAGQGQMSPTEYKAAMRDLTAFLSYVGEPFKLERQRLGTYVLIFIAIFFVLAYLLKKEYWKDVH